MKYGSLFLCFLGCLAFGQTDYVAPVKTVLDKHSDTQLLVAVYNARNADDIPLPENLSSAKIIKVGIKSVSDVSRLIVNDILKRESVQVLFLYDDQGKLVTNKRTLTYLMKQAKKFDTKVFSDSQVESSKQIHGRVIRKGSQWELIYELENGK